MLAFAMLALCTVIGLLCVPPDYVPLTRSFAMFVQVDERGKQLPERFDEALSKRRGIEISSIDSDYFQVVSTLGLDRVCTQDRCAYYRKRCEPTACHYRITTVSKDHGAPQGLMVSMEPNVEVRAPTPAALRKIIGRLRYVLKYESKSPVLIPLTRFSHESPSLNMRGCMRSIWVQGCPRPEFPQFRAREHP